MDKPKLWALLTFALAIGLLAGCKSSSCPESGSENDTAQINNADLNVGDPAPDFRLPNHKGGYVRLSDFEGTSNVVVAFFPAAFTPV